MNITNDKVTAYIDGLYRPLSRELGALRKEAEAAMIPVILKDAETLLLNLIRIKNPVSVLEIGTAVGYSAACMARACPGCRVTTIEADETMVLKAENNIRALGLADRIRVLHGKAEDVITKQKERFDFVFIDAAKSHYRKFWDSAVSLCVPGAVIVCDNVLMRATTASDEYDTKNKHRTSIRNMRDFLSYITEIADTSVLPVGDGIAISILKG